MQHRGTLILPLELSFDKDISKSRGCLPQSKMVGNSTAKNESKPGAICAFLEDTSAEVNLKAFAYCLIAIGSLLGNSLVILVILKNRKMRSPINYLIINMASSDILFTVFVIPRLIVELYSAPRRWFVSGIFGSLLCKLVYFIQDIATAVSILSLVAIAFDRFYGVVYPMKSGLISRGKICGLVLACTWFLAALLHLPYFYVYKLSNDSLCRYSWGPNVDSIQASRAYFVVMSVTLFFFPATIIIIVYGMIVISLWRKKFPGIQSLKDKKRISKRNRSVLKMVVAVVVVFICCWLPVNVSIYLSLFHWGFSQPCYRRTLFFWVILLAYSNVCITPFLYFIFNENFRQGFRHVFFHRKEAGSFPSNRHSTRRGTRSYAVSHTSLKMQDGRKKL